MSLFIIYLFPVSKGCPAAFGALEDLEKSTKATKVTMYGKVFNSTPGISDKAGIACETLAIVEANPKKKVAPKIPRGFH